jgi:uncharacterized protein YbaR (Trm112 family)
MNCAYASPVFSAGAVACVDRGAGVCAGAATAGLTAKATTANHFIRLELFHKSAKVSYIPNMAVDPELLEILACPNCKTPVTLIRNGAALKCATCKRVYPIKDDIPIMLIDEATIEE